MSEREMQEALRQISRMRVSPDAKINQTTLMAAIMIGRKFMNLSPIVGSASPVAPSEEVMVDAAMIERAQNAYRVAGETRGWHPSWPDADAMREIFTAALSEQQP